MVLNIHHSFWTQGMGLVPCFYLPAWSKMTRRGTTVNSAYDVKEKETLRHPRPSPRPRRRIRLPGSFNAESRRKKLMKEICKEAMGVKPPWDFSGDVTRGQATLQHQSPAEGCLSLRTHIDLLWEPAPTSRTLFKFVLATWAEFRWATSLRPKSALKCRFAHLHKSKKNRPWLGLSSCC